MKKVVLNPLALDKETIAKLDERQLMEIVGGVANDFATGTSGSCDTGGSGCTGGTSGGCTTGGSTCAVEEA